MSRMFIAGGPSLRSFLGGGGRGLGAAARGGGRAARGGGGGAGRGRSFASVVATDEIVRQIEVGLREQHRRLLLVEDHREVLGLGDLADDAAHPLEDLAGGLLL